MQKFSFYNEKKPENQSQHRSANIDKLIEIQTAQLKNDYKTDCLDAKQLKTVLNVGETNAYEWLKKCPATRVINDRRKVVPIVWVAYYLVTGQI